MESSFQGLHLFFTVLILTPQARNTMWIISSYIFGIGEMIPGQRGDTISHTLARIPFFTGPLRPGGWWYFWSLRLNVNSDQVSNNPQSIWLFPFYQCIVAHVNGHESLWGKDWGNHCGGICLPWYCRIFIPRLLVTYWSIDLFWIWKLAQV